MKKPAQHEKMYKNSPKLERGEDKKIHVVKSKKEAKGKMDDHEMRHAHERQAMRDRHSGEHMEMGRKHEAEHVGKKDKKDMHKRHHEDMKSMHKNHAAEMREMLAKHEDEAAGSSPAGTPMGGGVDTEPSAASASEEPGQGE